MDAEERTEGGRAGGFDGTKDGKTPAGGSNREEKSVVGEGGSERNLGEGREGDEGVGGWVIGGRDRRSEGKGEGEVLKGFRRVLEERYDQGESIGIHLKVFKRSKGSRRRGEELGEDLKLS